MKFRHVSTHCKLSSWEKPVFITYILISKKPVCIVEDSTDSKCNVIHIYLQAKSLKVYTGLLAGSGV